MCQTYLLFYVRMKKGVMYDYKTKCPKWEEIILDYGFECSIGLLLIKQIADVSGVT